MITRQRMGSRRRSLVITGDSAPLRLAHDFGPNLRVIASDRRVITAG